MAFEEAGYDPACIGLDYMLDALRPMLAGDKHRVSVYLWGKLRARFVGEMPRHETPRYRDFARQAHVN